MSEETDSKEEGQKEEGQKEEGQKSEKKKRFKEMMDRIESLSSQIAELKGGKKLESDLYSKTEDHNKEREKTDQTSKEIEEAVLFNSSIPSFIQDNRDILPSDVSDIIAVADKERYDRVSDKERAVKSAILQSFFKIESNLDLLTQTQKRLIDDYFKLSSKGKEDRAKDVYSNVFEPSVMMLKKIKKAEEVAKSRNGVRIGSKPEQDYLEKMIKISKQKHMPKEVQ